MTIALSILPSFFFPSFFIFLFLWGGGGGGGGGGVNLRTVYLLSELHLLVCSRTCLS